MSIKTVTARMTVERNEPVLSPGYQYNTVQLRALYHDGKGNESWSQATPSGDCRMTITNPGAYEFFEPGVTYEMEFHKLVKQADGTFIREE